MGRFGFFFFPNTGGVEIVDTFAVLETITSFFSSVLVRFRFSDVAPIDPCLFGEETLAIVYSLGTLEIGGMPYETPSWSMLKP